MACVNEWCDPFAGHPLLRKYTSGAGGHGTGVSPERTLFSKAKQPGFRTAVRTDSVQLARPVGPAGR